MVADDGELIAGHGRVPAATMLGLTEVPVIRLSHLDDARPLLMVTEPRYGVAYDPSWRNQAGAAKTKCTGKVLDDGRADWREAWALFPGEVAYVWHGALHAAAVDTMDGHGRAGGRHRSAGLCQRPAQLSRLRLAPHQMGLDRPGQGCRDRDLADRGGPEIPHAGHRRARLRRRTGRPRDRRGTQARSSTGSALPATGVARAGGRWRRCSGWCREPAAGSTGQQRSG